MKTTIQSEALAMGFNLEAADVLARSHAAAKAAGYIAGIRNVRKRDYAKRYLAYVAAGSPEVAAPEYAPLSYMAAQAVRLEIRQRLGHLAP